MILMDASHSHYTNEMNKVEAELAAIMANVAQKRQKFNETQSQLERIRVRLIHLFAYTEMDPNDRGNYNRPRKSSGANDMFVIRNSKRSMMIYRLISRKFRLRKR